MVRHPLRFLLRLLVLRRHQRAASWAVQALRQLLVPLRLLHLPHPGVEGFGAVLRAPAGALLQLLRVLPLVLPPEPQPVRVQEPHRVVLVPALLLGVVVLAPPVPHFVFRRQGLLRVQIVRGPPSAAGARADPALVVPGVLTPCVRRQLVVRRVLLLRRGGRHRQDVVDGVARVPCVLLSRWTTAVGQPVPRGERLHRQVVLLAPDLQLTVWVGTSFPLHHSRGVPTGFRALGVETGVQGCPSPRVPRLGDGGWVSSPPVAPPRPCGASVGGTTGGLRTWVLVFTCRGRGGPCTPGGRPG